MSVRRPHLCGALVSTLLAAACSQQPDGARPLRSTPPPTLLHLRELFPNIRADVNARVVEFDAYVSPILVVDPKAPLVFIEVLACIPDTREHETLVVTRAKPSHLHAALLSIGARAGSPGGFRRDSQMLTPIEPQGDTLDIRFIYADVEGERSIDPLSWVISARDGRPFREVNQPRLFSWVFAGSREVQAGGALTYAADLGGNVVGFSTFGDEVIALSTVLSPEAAVLTPEWIADFARVPPARTPVRVRLALTAPGSPQGPDQDPSRR